MFDPNSDPNPTKSGHHLHTLVTNSKDVVKHQRPAFIYKVVESISTVWKVALLVKNKALEL